MPKTYRNLWPQVVSFENLWAWCTTGFTRQTLRGAEQEPSRQRLQQQQRVSRGGGPSPAKWPAEPADGAQPHQTAITCERAQRCPGSMSRIARRPAGPVVQHPATVRMTVRRGGNTQWGL